MNRDKRHVLLYYFNLKKTAAEVHRLLSEMYETPSERTCRVWFECFRNGNFYVRDKEGRKNLKISSCKYCLMRIQLKRLSKALNVTPKVVSKRLHAMGRIHKEGIWLPHGLSENAILNRLSIATSLFARQRKKSLCCVSWLTMKNGFILIISSRENHEWIPANHPLLHEEEYSWA